MSSSEVAVFLDRDGVINEKAPEGSYITDLSHFKILPGRPRCRRPAQSQSIPDISNY